MLRTLLRAGRGPCVDSCAGRGRPPDRVPIVELTTRSGFVEGVILCLMTTTAGDASSTSDAATSRARGGYAKGRATREEILDSAMQLFGEVGYRTASLREVSAR